MLKLCTLITCALIGGVFSVAQAQPVSVPMSPGNFEPAALRTGSPGDGIQFGEFLGRRAVYLPSGLLIVKAARFRDGIVDADVAAKPGGLFLGIAFRVESEANLEVLYLRPLASDTIEAMQYTPRLNGDAIWQLLSSDHEKAKAHIPQNQWIHIKLVVRGRMGRVFLNASKVPALVVTNLRLGDSEGGIALWSLGGGGYFSNLSYTVLPARNPMPDLPRFRRAGLLSDWDCRPHMMLEMLMLMSTRRPLPNGKKYMRRILDSCL